ncbi:uncharacterized protein LOC123220587 isoform X1 [Mangifera indica]|uniref:uncharacterized protein LOC123220587 isoform X1 n=1 Tax=Mangifera indica TaxID=29780 RepID=UPI001CF99A95|nr:uncharacterized protein LOC123220587 isoform X1 [Mangifera indica]
MISMDSIQSDPETQKKTNPWIARPPPATTSFSSSIVRASTASRESFLREVRGSSTEGAKSKMTIRDSSALMMENARSCLHLCILNFVENFLFILWFKIWERHVGCDEPLIDKLSFDSQCLKLCGGKASEGVSVGALLSMSSTAAAIFCQVLV